MTYQEIINWLLQGDVSIQYQTYRDLLCEEKKDLRNKIEQEGWGYQFLSLRNSSGHWGRAFYQPKWISTHYTLLDLKSLQINQDCKPIKETCRLIMEQEKAPDGGVGPIGTIKASDICIGGMALNYLSYFQTNEEDLKSIVDFLIANQMHDGGFNCQSNRKGAHHSSMHSTLSVLEGIQEYILNGYKYRIHDLKRVKCDTIEFIFQHRLFKSDKTGEIIKPGFLKLTYPSRWYYDILRALDFFQLAKINYDDRMQDALDILINKRNKDNTWNLQAMHPGEVHFHMEKAGKPSRWNTLRVLRVLKYFNVSTDPIV